MKLVNIFEYFFQKSITGNFGIGKILELLCRGKVNRIKDVDLVDLWIIVDDKLLRKMGNTIKISDFIVNFSTLKLESLYLVKSITPYQWLVL